MSIISEPGKESRLKPLLQDKGAQSLLEIFLSSHDLVILQHYIPAIAIMLARTQIEE
ncbi:hypothetical protein ACO0LC_02185 [Undibacterium sp. JH2W]|uniref:hypothetical protein n=1 Tax=Undibacterium sp. JH2W TaxID=3413037 RepID=UPI003BF11BC6